MRRVLALLLALCMIPALCACGKERERAADTAAAAATAVPGVDPATGRWLGSGGCYRLESAEEAQAGGVSFAGADWRLSYDWPGYRVLRDGECVYETQELLLGVGERDGELWIAQERREGESWTVLFGTLSPEGALTERFTVTLTGDASPRQFAPGAEGLQLNCVDALRLYDDQGTLLAQVPHEPWAGRILRASDGALYFLEAETGGGGVLRRLRDGTLETQFSFLQGSLCTGDDQAPFLLIKAEGLDRVWTDGHAEPLVVWAECGLAVSGVTAAEARDDGSYLLTGLAAPLRMLPARPEELKARTRLRLGVLPADGRDFAAGSANLIRSVSAFNVWSQDCVVELEDLSEGGALDESQAVLRLNTRLLSGDGPDMLAFSEGGLSPFPYLRRGLLLDLEDFTGDGGLALEDILIAPMVKEDLGGLYLLGERWSIESRVGLRERFGPVWGWDYETYLRLDREAAPGTMVMYNLSRDYFLRQAAGRFARDAMDWRAGTCDFDNEDFVRLLEVVRDLRETPEDPENMVFGAGGALLEGGYMLTELCMIASAEDYARLCRGRQKPVSFIGFPTPDGSGGTDIRFSDALGVLSTGEHAAACWGFLRYLLTHSQASLPVYRPLLEQRLREAGQASAGEDEPFALDPPMTAEEVEGLWTLLSHVEHCALYDEAALAVIAEELGPVLAGDRSAAEAARLVQSRLSIYLAEQAG